MSGFWEIYIKIAIRLVMSENPIHYKILENIKTQCRYKKMRQSKDLIILWKPNIGMKPIINVVLLAVFIKVRYYYPPILRRYISRRLKIRINQKYIKKNQKFPAWHKPIINNVRH